jgi:hypothetical protein
MPLFSRPSAIKACALLAPWLVFAAPAGAQSGEIDPPPPPPAPQMPAPQPGPGTGSAGEPVKPGPPTALDRYQECFQQMIDSGASDNAFMRQCLGIEETAPADQKSAKRFSRDDANAVLESSLKNLEVCYNQLLERSQSLQLIPEGVIDPVIAVGDKGQVTGINFEPTQFMDIGLLECAKKKLTALSFKKAPAGTVIKTSIRFNATGPKRVGKASLVKGGPRLSGPAFELSSKDILAVFQKYSPRVRACYDDLVKRSPKSGGTVAVDLTVNAAGRVRKVHYRENTISDRRFKNCVTTQLKTFRFPKPVSEEDVVVRYPSFVFSPQKQ